MWSLVTYWIAVERQRTLDAATQQLEQLNAAVSGQIETLLKLAETSFSAANHWLVENPDADPYEAPAFLGLVEELHRLTDGIVDLRAADHTGKSQWFGRERRDRPLDIADRDYFQAQFDPKTQGLFIGQTFVGRQSALLGIPLSVRAEGRRLAILFAVIKLDHLRALHEPQRMKPNGSITLIRQDGLILSRTPFAESALNQDISHHPDFVDHLARSSRGVLTSGVSPVDSKSRLVGFAKLERYPLFVISSALIDDVLLPWRKEAGRLGVIVGLVTVLTLVLAGRLLRAMQAREQAQLTAERAYRRFSDIVETASDMVWEMDADGRFSYASERFETLQGIAPRDMIGKTPAELGWAIPELTALRRARKPIAGVNITGFHRPDGSPMILRCFARPFDDELGQFAGYRGTVTDVTDGEELRHLVKVINENVGDRIGEEFLKTLLVDASHALHASAAYIARVDWQSRQADAVYLYEDGSFREPERFSLDGSPIGAIASGETTIVTSGACEQFPTAPVINRQRGESYAGTPLRDQAGQIFGLLAVVGRRPFEDTERVKAVLQLFAGRVAAEMARAAAQAAAEQSRQEMSRVLAALDLSRDHISVLDENAEILYANRVARESAGLPPKFTDFKGLRWRDFQPSPEYQAQLAERQAALRRDGFWQGEVNWVRPVDGVVVAWELRQTLLPNGASVVVATDISERRRIEAERLHQQQLRAQANKMEALGQLAGGVAHDFNNLLGAILGFAQLITQDHPPESDTGRFAERIVRAGQRGRSLIEQILTFSRRNVIEPVTLELTEIVEETRDLLRPTLPSTTRLVVSGEAGAMVFVDRGQMSQVLINLGVNASDALLGEAGLVEIHLGATDRSAPAVARLPLAEGRPTPASVEAWEDVDGTGWIITGGIGRGPTVSITVSDTGAGMPAAVRPHIFEPFFTTKDKSRGTGLGLAVIHTIVIEHGGAIVVRTANGRGTSFEVILPLAEEQAVVAAPPPPALLQAQRSGRVLLVDDDPDFLAMAGATLRRLGHRVRSLGDPIEALQTLRNEPGAWDILVTDQTMPQLKGGELLIAAKMLAPRLHCIVCTGSGRALDLAEAAGAVATFSKPLDLDSFADTIGKLIEETFETRRLAL